MRVPGQTLDAHPVCYPQAALSGKRDAIFALVMQSRVSLLLFLPEINLRSNVVRTSANPCELCDINKNLTVRFELSSNLVRTRANYVTES